MKRTIICVLALVLVLALAGCGNAASGSSNSQQADAAATASTYTNLYTNLDQAAVLDAMRAYSGLCNVATVNADGTPNIAIFVPGVADDSHIMFGFADNSTKANLLRDKVAEISYDIANPAAETKEARHQGAVLKVELEEDEAVLAELKANNENITDAYTLLKIVEVMPIG